MNNFIKRAKKLYRDVRDPIYRLFRLNEIAFLNQYIDKETSIFSMNCFGGKIYQDLHRRYTSPTAGLFFTAEDFNKVLRDISVIRNPLIFTPPSKKRCSATPYPVAVISGTDIHIHFLHYKSDEEARRKWENRVKRFNFDKYIVIGFYQNGCSEDIIRDFSNLPQKDKFYFSTIKLELPGIIYTPEYEGRKSHPDAVKYANVFYKHLVKYIKTNKLEL